VLRSKFRHENTGSTRNRRAAMLRPLYVGVRENIFLDQTFSQFVALIERTGLQELGNGRLAGPRVRGPFEVPLSSPMGRINRKPFDGPLDVLIAGPGCP